MCSEKKKVKCMHCLALPGRKKNIREKEPVSREEIFATVLSRDQLAQSR